MRTTAVAQLLQAGKRLRLVDLRETLERRADGAWAITAQGDVLSGSPYERFSRAVRWLIESAKPHTISCLDLSRLEGVDPHEIVRAVRDGVLEARPEGQRPVRRSPRLPRRCRGERFLALAWSARTESERHLRAAFTLAWDILDRSNPQTRIALPFIEDRRARVLSHLPVSLSGERLDTLLTARVLTYHGLRVDTVRPGNDAKQLGRLLRRYEELGLAVPRQYARGEVRERAGAEGRAAQFGRPRLWESVPAAAAELFGGRKRSG